MSLEQAVLSLCCKLQLVAGGACNREKMLMHKLAAQSGAGWGNISDLLEVHCIIDLSLSFVGFNQCNLYWKELKEKFKTFITSFISSFTLGAVTNSIYNMFAMCDTTLRVTTIYKQI